MDNLAGDPALVPAQSRLRDALGDWVESQSDPGAAVDTVQAMQASRRGEHLHGSGPEN